SDGVLRGRYFGNGPGGKQFDVYLSECTHGGFDGLCRDAGGGSMIFNPVIYAPKPSTHIYGVEWDGTQTTAWSRTDAAETFMNPTPAVNNGNGSSPFDTIMPWAGMVVEDDATAGKLVKIPKYWFKWTR